MKKISKHFNWIVFLLISFIAFELGFLATFFVNWADVGKTFSSAAVGKGSLPKVFIVQSGSMEPAIATGSIVVTLPQKYYRVGEVVTFTLSPTGKNLVTHRIVSISGEGEFTTKGDANEDADTQIVKSESIVGKTFISIPYLGYAANFAKNPKGFILLVIVPATIVIYEEIKNLKKEITKFFGRVKTKFFPKKNKITVGNYDDIFPNTTSLSNSKNVPAYAVAVPVLGVLMVLVAFSASYFSDREKSINNILGAAENYTDPQPAPQNPVINEFLPDSATEFVEFYNPQGSAEYLKTYYLDDDTTFGDGVGQGSDMILLTTLNTTNINYPYIEMSSFLNNPGDTVALFDNLGNIVDQYVYPPPSPQDEITIGRIPDSTGSFVNLSVSSKGAVNQP